MAVTTIHRFSSWRESNNFATIFRAAQASCRLQHFNSTTKFLSLQVPTLMSTLANARQEFSTFCGRKPTVDDNSSQLAADTTQQYSLCGFASRRPKKFVLRAQCIQNTRVGVDTHCTDTSFDSHHCYCLCTAKWHVCFIFLASHSTNHEGSALVSPLLKTVGICRPTR